MIGKKKIRITNVTINKYGKTYKRQWLICLYVDRNSKIDLHRTSAALVISPIHAFLRFLLIPNEIQKKCEEKTKKSDVTNLAIIHFCISFHFYLFSVSQSALRVQAL